MKKMLYLAAVGLMALLTVSCSEDNIEYFQKQYGVKPVKALTFTRLSSDDGDMVVNFLNTYDGRGRLVDCIIDAWHMRLTAEYKQNSAVFHVFGRQDGEDQPEGTRLTATLSNGKITTIDLLYPDDDLGWVKDMQIDYEYDADGKPIVRSVDDDPVYFTWEDGNMTSMSWDTKEAPHGELLDCTNIYEIAYSDQPNKVGVIPNVILNGMDAFSILGDFYFKNLPISATRIKKWKDSGEEEEEEGSITTFDWELDTNGFPLSVTMINGSTTAKIEFQY